MSGSAVAWCVMDPVRLHRLLLNLAVNARDAMPHGGKLTVRATRRTGASGEGILGPIPAGDWAVLGVEDTGTGMTDEVKRRAFEPFFTTKQLGKGTGLGLATIAVSVEQGGGHVAVDSNPEKGTRIEVWLPAVASGTPRATPPVTR